MSDAENGFKNWEDVILGFFRRKQSLEEEKYLKEKIKEVGSLFKKEGLLDNDDISLIFDAKRYKKNKGEMPLGFQYRRAIEIIKLKNSPKQLNVFREMKAYLKHAREVANKYTPSNWFSVNCKNASNVSFATHVAKLTHSKIDSPSIFDDILNTKNGYLTTSSLKEKAIDGAVAGNQFAPIFQFLELELDGNKLAEQLANDDDILKCFSEEGEVGNEQLREWNGGFRNALKSNNLATHSLAKQIYYPKITDDNDFKYDNEDYHLLLNIVSSSLAHTVFEKIFDPTQKEVKKILEKDKHSSDVFNKYINRSYLCVTASNHSNASQLNGKRAGKLHLFSSQPPAWKSQLKPPTNKVSLFLDIYNSTIKTELDYLRDFLLRFKGLDLSIKDPKRKRHLIRWVDNIIDECLFYIGTIQNLPAGWSAADNIRLKPEHQYLLDPYRRDDAYQTERQSTQWQSVICADFSLWLNRQLRGKEFTPQAEHTRLWKKLMEQALREYMEPIEQEIKQSIKEAV